jgi:hypothetical protein
MVDVVSLRDVVDGLQMVSNEAHAYLNKLTGKVIMITDDDFVMAENDDEFESATDLREHSGLEMEFFQEVKKVVASDDDYEELPDRFEINEYEIMQRFCFSLPNAEISTVLLDEIHGSGAFRRFKDTIYRYRIEKDWFQFRDEAYKEIAILWLESHDYAYMDDMNR